MKKIVVRMRGGLGNQLFIISYAYSIAKKLNTTDYEIVLDNREYKNYKIRNFEILDIIKDEKIRMYNKKTDKSLRYDISRKIYHIIQKFLPDNMNILDMFAKKGLLYSKRSAESRIVPYNKGTIYIYGYFQDEKMVSDVKDILLNKISCNTLDSKKYLEKDKKNIAISIRCGQDYINQKWPICGEKYYKSAIKEIINSKYTNERFNIIVFSDDIEKAKKMNLHDDARYIEKMSAIEQLIVMSKCDDFIISNSSFSWWGAYLGMKKNTIIIAPNLWYPTKEQTVETLLYHKGMTINRI